MHSGIDGYSRLPVYLKASSNNKAETVLQCFQDGVIEYGLPSRVRSDKGRENIEVAAYMLNHVQQGPGRGSMITGIVFEFQFFYPVISVILLGLDYYCVHTGQHNVAHLLINRAALFF